MPDNQQQPNLTEGLQYWDAQSADYNGVLGGYGEGSLPRIDAFGSRKFLMSLMPRLCTVSSSLRKLRTNTHDHPRVCALDVGCGVGRTTKDVLLHLVDDVILVEPVLKFLSVAMTDSTHWKGIQDSSKGVTLIQAPLQALDPVDVTKGTNILGRVGYIEESTTSFDIIWCQWCLGHLSNDELIEFFQKSKRALRIPAESLIVVKENTCRDADDGSPRTVFDDQDSSLTRSNAAWLQLFTAAGLELVEKRVQTGFPAELYVVNMYALR